MQDPLVSTMELLDLHLVFIPNPIDEFAQTRLYFFFSVKYKRGKEGWKRGVAGVR